MGNIKALGVVLDKGAIMPTRAHPTDAGLDLYTPTMLIIPPEGRCIANTGVHVSIPAGYVGNLESKSGLMANKGITCRGTIDAGYTGPIKAVLFNHSGISVTFEPGDKITQLVIRQVETPDVVVVDSFEETERGDGAFGSTGR